MLRDARMRVRAPNLLIGEAYDDFNRVSVVLFSSTPKRSGFRWSVCFLPLCLTCP